MLGGLKATFLASYIHSFFIYAFLWMFIFVVYAKGGNKDNCGAKICASSPELQGSPLYDASCDFYGGDSDCIVNPCPNAENRVFGANGNYLTMSSVGGIVFGVVNIVGNFGTVFVDQSYWQSAIAAKPSATVKGFLLGGLSWFAIPFVQATTL